MSTKRTLLLLLALTTVAFSADATTEPNLATPKPRFEISDVPLSMAPSFGGTRPKYWAQVTLLDDRSFAPPEALGWIMDSAWAEKLSQAQKDFLAGPSGNGRRQGYGIEGRGGPGRDHVSIDLYAISEEDAKIMALALLDVLTTRARTARTRHSRWVDGLKKEAEQREVELSEKDKRLKEVDSKYDQRKKALYPHLRDDEAAQLAKELVFQMNKEGKMLDIELAGIHAKLNIIEGYLHEPDLDNPIRARLEGMKIDQLIELASLKEREEAIERIRTAEQQFYSLYSERRQLHQTVPGLRSALKGKKQRIERETAKLERQPGEMVPPRVYENKVIIYPIQASDSQN
ncbi:MAG: hypothetical protein ACYTAS_03275 [Planctomycetota bacterium]|jgi:hypothetical protein